jgi:hypothetical protein
MWFKRKTDNTLTVFDDRGFKISISVERFNKLNVFVDTDVEKNMVDAHFAALDRYNSYFLSLLVKRDKIVALTRDLLSVGRIKWNLARIYRKMERIVVSISTKLNLVKSKDHGGDGRSE